MPLGQSVSANISELSRSKAGQKRWPRKRIIAAAMNAAREEGGKVKPKPGMHKMPDKHMMDDEDMEGMMPKKKPKLRYLGKHP